jgi:DNA-binding CsgD family transcriptional regulator
LFDELEKHKPRLLLLESNCWFTGTPFKIAELLQQRSDLRIAIFNIDRKLDTEEARYITIGGAMSFIEMRSDKMHGTEKEYMFGFQETVNGRSYIPQTVETAIENEYIENLAGYANTYKMTDHQIEIAKFYAEGKTSDEIAVILKISPATVRNIKQAIRSKLGVRTAAELTYTMIQLGYITTKEITANMEHIFDQTTTVEKDNNTKRRSHK